MSVGDINSKSKGSGARYNDAKPDFSLLPLSTLEEEIRVWEYGAKKYKEWNWVKGMDWSIPFSCAMRHLAAWQAGEDNDPETGYSHLAHALCNLRMLTLYAKTYPEGDNREKNFTKEFFQKSRPQQQVKKKNNKLISRTVKQGSLFQIACSFDFRDCLVRKMGESKISQHITTEIDNEFVKFYIDKSCPAGNYQVLFTDKNHKIIEMKYITVEESNSLSK